ncbi:hypothetical protein STEG23_031618 [Scotinomys teguina]
MKKSCRVIVIMQNPVFNTDPSHFKTMDPDMVFSSSWVWLSTLPQQQYGPGNPTWPSMDSPPALYSGFKGEKDLVKLDKRLKKEKVNVDIINFGEEEVNTEKLMDFVNTLNGKDRTGPHLVTVPPRPSLADALISSPILTGEGGAMLGLGASDFEFGVDPSADPELVLALRVSMEEQRQQQEEEAWWAATASAAKAGIAPSGTED